MSTSPLVRLLAVSCLGIILFSGCARDLGTQGPGTGDSGPLSDGGPLPEKDQTGLYNNPLPPRDESVNLETADYATLEPYTVYFGFDSFTIAPEERAKLEKISEYLKKHSGTKVVLAGHTDSRGTTQYNLALGDRRANAVREYLIGLGVPAAVLIPQSYGEERPVDPGTSEAAYAKNRRVATGILK